MAGDGWDQCLSERVFLSREEAFSRLHHSLSSLGFTFLLNVDRLQFSLYRSYMIEAKLEAELANYEDHLVLTLRYMLLTRKAKSCVPRLEDILSFVKEGKAEGRLSHLSLPEQPFVTPELLASPYPRQSDEQPHKTRNQRPLLARNPKIIKQFRKCTLPPETLLSSIRAQAYIMGFREHSAASNHIVFWRGEAAEVPEYLSGDNLLPAILIVTWSQGPSPRMKSTLLVWEPSFGSMVHFEGKQFLDYLQDPIGPRPIIDGRPFDERARKVDSRGYRFLLAQVLLFVALSWFFASSGQFQWFLVLVIIFSMAQIFEDKRKGKPAPYLPKVSRESFYDDRLTRSTDPPTWVDEKLGDHLDNALSLSLDS